MLNTKNIYIYFTITFLLGGKNGNSQRILRKGKIWRIAKGDVQSIGSSGTGSHGEETDILQSVREYYWERKKGG